MRPKVFISAPLTTGLRSPDENYKLAMRVAADLTVRGYGVECPHHSWVLARDYAVDLPHDRWMELSLEQLHGCDAMFRIPGESKGAKIEDDAAVGWAIPIFKEYPDLDRWRENDFRRKPGSQRIVPRDRRFTDEQEAQRKLHDSKGSDYSPTGDPYGNIKAAAAIIHVRPWQYCVARIQEKLNRLAAYATKGSLWNESAIDSLRDISITASIGKITMDEDHGGT